MQKAFLFDLNGTMIDDMRYHISAWHRIISDLGNCITLDEMRNECYGKNHEILERIFPGRFGEAEKTRMSWDKETEYQRQFRPSLALIPGLKEFLEKAYQHQIPMAIGTAAITFNIDFVLDNLNIRHYFKALVSADDVHHSKPHPETFLKCAELLGVSPQHCIVFEDAPKGVESAFNAGMNCVVLTIIHSRSEFEKYSNVLQYINDYAGLDPVELLNRI